MKIDPGWRPLGHSLRPADHAGQQPVQSPPFADFMRQQDGHATHQHLNRMLEQIQLQGERLAQSMTLRELRQYKLLVRRFLEETVRRGVGLRETQGSDRRGRGKRYKLLEQLDESLLAMADELMLYEQGRINILYKIGEIRGMLINLFY